MSSKSDFLKTVIRSLSPEKFSEAVAIFERSYLNNEIVSVDGHDDGGCDIKIFFTFIVGVAIFKGSGAILNLMVPHSSLAFGCKCATYKWIPDENGVVQKVSTGLTEECETITEDTTAP